MHKPLLHLLRVQYCIALLASCALQAAPDLSQTQLLGKWTGDPTDNRLGGATAISDKWVLLGADQADEQATDQGAVQVFTPTGTFVRKLLPPTTTANQRFGSALEISADLAIVGAPGTVTQAGGVHVYNLKTGALVRSLASPTNAPGDSFGVSLAVEGDILAVGASGGTQRVCLYRLSDGQLQGQAFPSDPQANAFFGQSVDILGGLMLVGAPFLDDGGADRGAVYWYSVATPSSPVQLSRTLIPGSGAGAYCGISVKLHQNLGIVACAGMAVNEGQITVLDPRANVTAPVVLKTLSSSGSSFLGVSLDVADGLIVAGGLDYDVALFDISGSSSTPLRVIKTPGFLQCSSVALHDSTLLIGTEGDSTQGNFAGAGHLLRHVTRSSPLKKVAGKGEFAPGVVEASFAAFTDCRVNGNGHLAISGKLAGPGSGGGKDLGIWETLGGSPLTLGGKSRLIADGATINTLSNPLIKASETLLVPATTIPATTLFRATINSPAKPALFRDDGTEVKLVFAGGSIISGAEILRFGQVSVPAVDNSVAFQSKFKLGSGTTANDDSALVWHRFQHNSAPPINSETGIIREGAASGFAAASGETSAPLIGEVSQQAALTGTGLFSIQQLTGPADKNQGLISRSTVSGALQPGFRKGVSTPPDFTGMPLFGTLFRSFLGISSDTDNRILFRATLSGLPSANNEGLWGMKNPAQIIQLFSKGSPLTGLEALVAGFRAYWASANQHLALLTLKGPSVNASNDQALVLMQIGGPTDGTPLVLMREGDPAPGLHPARIGVIQQVDVEPASGQYLILATLTNCPPGRNLALFRGHSKAPLSAANQRLMRLPYPILRKGTLFAGQTSRLKSFNLPANTRSPSGAGNIGLGSAIQGSSNTASTALTSILVFENGSTQVAAGTP